MGSLPFRTEPFGRLRHVLEQTLRFNKAAILGIEPNMVCVKYRLTIRCQYCYNSPRRAVPVATFPFGRYNTTRRISFPLLSVLNDVSRIRATFIA